MGAGTAIPPYVLAILISWLASLEAAEIPFTLSSSGRRALFCRDFDGNAFEFVER